MPREKKKLVIIGLDHDAWEEYFDFYIPQELDERHYMYHESWNPGARGLDGFTETKLIGFLNLVLTDFFVSISTDPLTAQSQISRHGIFLRDYPSELAMRASYLLIASTQYNSVKFSDFIEEHDLSMCVTYTLDEILVDHDELQSDHKILKNPNTPLNEVERLYRKYRTKVLLQSMSTIDFLIRSDTLLGDEVNVAFGGVDLTEINEGDTGKIIDQLTIKMVKLRDKDVFNRVNNETFTREIMGDKNVFLMAVGTAHIPNIIKLMKSHEFIQWDVDIVSIDADDIGGIHRAGIDDVFADKMNQIRIALGNQPKRRSGRVSKKRRTQLSSLKFL